MAKYLILLITLIAFEIGYTQIQTTPIDSITTINDGIIKVESSPKIKNLIKNKIDYNSTNTSEKNYHIQIFYGSENGAIRTQNKFRELFPNTSTSLEFDSPNWKIKVGNYRTRLIADKHLQKIKLEFEGAIVLKRKK